MSTQDVEALLRAELGDVADHVEPGQAPVPAVVARGRTARRRRRAAGVAGAVLGTVAAVLAVSFVGTDVVRSAPPPPAATRTPLPREGEGRDRDKESASARDFVAWVKELPTSSQSQRVPKVVRQHGSIPLDDKGFPRLPTPDGSGYATLRPVGGSWEVQLRQVADDAVVARLAATEGSQPVGWVGGHLVLLDLGGRGLAVWRPGERQARLVGDAGDSEQVVSFAGDRLLLMQAPLAPPRCPTKHYPARVVEVRDTGISEIWTGCYLGSSDLLSPDGRFVVDSRALFAPIDLTSGSPRRIGDGGLSTQAWSSAPGVAWDAQSRWFQLRFDSASPGGTTPATMIRCSTSDGRCVRLTGGTAKQTNSPT